MSTGGNHLLHLSCFGFNSVQIECYQGSVSIEPLTRLQLPIKFGTFVNLQNWNCIYGIFYIDKIRRTTYRVPGVLSMYKIPETQMLGEQDLAYSYSVRTTDDHHSRLPTPIRILFQKYRKSENSDSLLTKRHSSSSKSDSLKSELKKNVQNPLWEWKENTTWHNEWFLTKKKKFELSLPLVQK